jgi:hypothetical protein
MPNLLKGSMQVRGYGLRRKPLSTTLDDWKERAVFE